MSETTDTNFILPCIVHFFLTAILGLCKDLSNPAPNVDYSNTFGIAANDMTIATQNPGLIPRLSFPRGLRLKNELNWPYSFSLGPSVNDVSICNPELFSGSNERGVKKRCGAQVPRVSTSTEWQLLFLAWHGFLWLDRSTGRNLDWDVAGFCCDRRYRDLQQNSPPMAGTTTVSTLPF